MICINLCGDPFYMLNLYNYMMVDLETMMVMVKGKGQELNVFPLRQCDGSKDSNWRQQSMVQNPRGLIYNGGRVHHFDEVLFAGSCLSAIAFDLRLFDLSVLMFVK